MCNLIHFSSLPSDDAINCRWICVCVCAWIEHDSITIFDRFKMVLYSNTLWKHPHRPAGREKLPTGFSKHHFQIVKISWFEHLQLRAEIVALILNDVVVVICFFASIFFCFVRLVSIVFRFSEEFFFIVLLFRFVYFSLVCLRVPCFTFWCFFRALCDYWIEPSVTHFYPSFRCSLFWFSLRCVLISVNAFVCCVFCLSFQSYALEICGFCKCVCVHCTHSTHSAGARKRNGIKIKLFHCIKFVKH